MICVGGLVYWCVGFGKRRRNVFGVCCCLLWLKIVVTACTGLLLLAVIFMINADALFTVGFV